MATENCTLFGVRPLKWTVSGGRIDRRWGIRKDTHGPTPQLQLRRPPPPLTSDSPLIRVQENRGRHIFRTRSNAHRTVRRRTSSRPHPARIVDVERQKYLTPNRPEHKRRARGQQPWGSNHRCIQARQRLRRPPLCPALWVTPPARCGSEAIRAGRDPSGPSGRPGTTPVVSLAHPF